ncbi:PEGA domain-containing protein [Methanosarcina sp. 1.H.A.2.2]|uniref:PEGA domain-containing protein n=1 Tax=Methanosarcina sp. 1.H.A.2.2 TaxID=1483601 RepID=UPI003182CA5B
MKIKPDLKRGVKPKDFRKILTCIVFSFLILTLAVSPVFADISTADSGQGNSTVEETEEAENPAAAEKGNLGKIEIITIPNGSEIYINEKLVGKTPALIEKVPPDFYEVMLTQEGYDDVFERVLVKAGKTASISKKLRVNERVYSISSSPSGANVYLDGKYKGITPVVFHAGEGQHKLAIKKTGYSTVSKEINASGETAPVMEEKLHLNLFTYFAATLVLLAAGIIIKRNPEKLKFKFPRKVSAGGRALEKFQRGSGKRDEKLQEKSSVPDDLVEMENFTEQNFEYTVKKKKKV